jgi:integrase
MDENVAAARLLLARLGVTPEQLLSGELSARAVPSFRDYVADVSTAAPAGTRRAYETYWRRIVEAWGERRLDEITPLEINRLAEQTKDRVTLRRNARDGRSAIEHLIAALRCLYRHAVDDGLISPSANPALRVAKPRRLASTRHALSVDRLAEIVSAATNSGNDPDLDGLILRLHIETACRRGGALALRPADLDRAQCLVRLREKGGAVRWQPVSPTLAQRLADHARERPAAPDVPLLRYRGGNAITARRYDHLWQRVGQHVSWVHTQQVSTHWLRHTTLTWVERNFGYAVARAYAGHVGRGDVGATATYVRADIHEVAAALAALTAEDHPLASERRMSAAPP